MQGILVQEANTVLHKMICENFCLNEFLKKNIF